MRRLRHSLTGSTTWVEYDGTDMVRTVWDGRANLGEVELDGPAGRLELLTLRLKMKSRRSDDVLVFYKFLNLALNSFRSPQSTLGRGGARNVSCEM